MKRLATKHRDWYCPKCGYKLRTQPTRYTPTHKPNPNATLTHVMEPKP